MTSKPPRVPRNAEWTHWGDPPPRWSLRCWWWVAEILGGWRPNRRVRAMGYENAAAFFGVWYWEYTRVIAPLLISLRRS